jgi:hypothetical protein
MAKSSFGVRNYRSSVKGRRPQPADMDYGDLAVNYNHADPALIIKGDDNALIEFKPGSVTVGAVAPAAAKDGDLWWDSTSARLFVRYTAGASPVSVWVDASPAAVPPAAPKVAMQPTQPNSPEPGDLWFNTNKVQLYAWYDDGSSKQWVSISQTGPKGDQGIQGPQGKESQKMVMSATPPATPVAGDLWFNTSKSILYVFYNDGTSSQWVSI